MSLKIDKALNLIVPVETDAGTIYIHSTPIGREVFERFFLVISKTFSALYSEGLSAVAGPRVAALMLKRLAIEAGIWEGDAGVENGLMAEIRRLSNVAIPTPAGWATVPLYDAVNRGHMTQEDVQEAEGCIVFFICISAMHKRKEVPMFLDGMCELWGTATTYLNCTEHAASLSTSTETETSALAVKPSSVPG